MTRCWMINIPDRSFYDWCNEIYRIYIQYVYTPKDFNSTEDYLPTYQVNVIWLIFDEHNPT